MYVTKILSLSEDNQTSKTLYNVAVFNLTHCCVVGG